MKYICLCVRSYWVWFKYHLKYLKNKYKKDILKRWDKINYWLSYKNIKYEIKNYLFKKYWPYEFKEVNQPLLFYVNEQVTIDGIQFLPQLIACRAKISFREELQEGFKIREHVYKKMKYDIAMKILGILPDPKIIDKQNGYTEFILEYPILIRSNKYKEE